MGIQGEAVFDSDEVQNFLRELSVRLKNIKDGEKKYIGLLSAIVYQDVLGHFKGEAGSEGPWQSWSSSYRKHMEKIGKGGNNILQWTGKLRNSFKPTNVRASNQGPVWFNNAQTKSGFAYAYAHNEGGTQLPRRDFMWLSDQSEEKIGKVTLQFMLDEGV